MLCRMATWERPVDVAAFKVRMAIVRIGQECREARQDRGLSVDAVAAATGVSNAEVSRVERGLAPQVSLVTLALIAAAVGLDLSARLYPGAGPIRDSPQVELLTDFRARLHRSLVWAAEVPVPIPGDRRAWDGAVAGPGWRYGVEGETAPRDVQAFHRRTTTKLRDSAFDGVLVAMRDTRRVREFVRVAGLVLGDAYPVPGRVALERLAVGQDPGGSSLIVLPRRPAPPKAPPDVDAPGPSTPPWT